MDQLTYNKTPVSPEAFVRLREMDLEAGWLGNLFGGGKTAAMNISGLVICLLVVCGFLFSCWRGFTESLPYWQLVLPTITLVLGYIFGRK